MHPMLHPRPIRVLHEPPSNLINVLGILVERLMSDQINPPHHRRQQQSRLPRFLSERAYGEQLAPALTYIDAAAGEHRSRDAAHKVPALPLLFHGLVRPGGA